MSDNRVRIFGAMQTAHDYFMGMDNIAADERFVAMWRDHMDFQPYVHLRGFETADQAFAFLTGKTTDDEDAIVLGVLDLAASVDKTFLPPRLTAGNPESLHSITIAF